MSAANSTVSTLVASPPNSNLLPRHLRDSMSSSNDPLGYTSANDSDENNDSDLGELVSMDEYSVQSQSNTNTTTTTTTGTSSSHAPESDDSDMAKEIEAAGEGESLLGSDDSGNDDTHLADEEQYMIQDEIKRHHDGKRQQQTYSVDNSLQKDVFGNEDDFWDSFASTHEQNDDGDVIANELFKPQRGFASTPEPLFSDFYGSSDETDHTASQADGDGDDEDALTTDEELVSSDNDGSSTISDIGSLSMPLIAHVGTTHNAEGSDVHQHDGEHGELDDKALKNPIPLLVIEDLDGRLIYARAGDGEAVFGSDGEFEFEGESDDESSDDDTMCGDDAHSIAAQSNNHDTHASDCDVLCADDGDTTDELPDNDMPYPRLLVGSIAPRGGRNARRAREIAARSRQSSPRVTPSTASAYATPRRKTNSSLSNVFMPQDEPSELTLSSASVRDFHDDETSEKVDKQPSATFQLDRESPEHPKPVMGQFMPASSKSIHRAVIDGSNRTPSPFSTLHSMQRGRRRKRTRYQQNNESFDQAVSNVPSSLRKRKHGDSFNSIPHDFNQPGMPHSNDGFESSPEPPDLHSADAMDLGDVLDEQLLWQGSSDNDSSNEEVSAVQDKRHGARRARLSQSGSCDRAMARWNRIPMGAFRTAQENGASLHAGPMSDAYMTHQRSGETYLLMHALQNPRQAFDASRASSHSISQRCRTPFRRSISLLNDRPNPTTSPLHGTLVDPAMGRHEKYNLRRLRNEFGEHAVVGGKFVVSPVLRPIKHRERSAALNNLNNATSPISSLSDVAPSQNGSTASTPNRKVTKREKRERLARREAVKQRQETVSVQPSYQ